MRPIKVLHVFKEIYTFPKHYYLGATKDILGRTEYFKSRGIEYTELLAKDKNRYIEALSKLSKTDLCQYTGAIFEMTFSPSAIRYIKKVSPHTKVIVRSHNAELLHRWDWTRTQGLTDKGLRSLRHTFKNSTFDYLSGRWADFIISISYWENDNYWSRIINKSKRKCVPFFLPESYEVLIPKGTSKKMQCVNFTSSIPNPLIGNATRNFIKSVENLDSGYRDWEFRITGNNAAYKIPTPARIEWTGFLKDPYRILAESRAMALLSDYGYGFKTKILEAILARAYIIMTKGLYNRMPEEVLPYCIPVDINSTYSFREALEKCAEPFPEGNPNAELRNQAFAALDEILLQ